ncbi:MAG: DUF1367 family protein [Gammaproteobacteria bacterium]|nr:DUF1367 family protein [Gammaproteobacteria bacterium]
MHLKVTEDYGLVPVASDVDAAKYLFNRTVGDILACDVKISRNYPNLKRFMKFIQVSYDMQDFFTEKEVYRYWITMKSGFFDTIVFPSGKAVFKARSVAFDEMEEDEFNELFSAAIDVFLREYGQGQTEDDILNVVGFG